MSIKIEKRSARYTDEEKLEIQQQFDYSLSQYSEVDNLYKIAKITALFFPYAFFATSIPIMKLIRSKNKIFKFWVIAPLIIISLWVFASIYIWYAYFSLYAKGLQENFPLVIFFGCSACLYITAIAFKQLSKFLWTIREFIYYKNAGRVQHFRAILAMRRKNSGFKNLFSSFMKRG